MLANQAQAQAQATQPIASSGTNHEHDEVKIFTVHILAESKNNDGNTIKHENGESVANTIEHETDVTMNEETTTTTFTHSHLTSEEDHEDKAENSTVSTCEKESDDTPRKESDDKLRKESDDTPRKESDDTPRKESDDTPPKESDDTLRKESDDTLRKESDDTLRKESDDTLRKESDDTLRKESDDTPRKESDDTLPKLCDIKFDEYEIKRFLQYTCSDHVPSFDELRKELPIVITPGFTSYKNMLNEFCQKKNLPVPKYTFGKFKYGFIATVTLALHHIECDVVCWTVKEAEARAAYEALRKLGYLKDEEYKHTSVLLMDSRKEEEKEEGKEEQGDDKTGEVYVCVNDMWKMVSQEELKKIQEQPPQPQQQQQQQTTLCQQPQTPTLTNGAPPGAPPFPIRWKLCSWFARGTCKWGASCRFIHPGVNDKQVCNDEQQLWNKSPDKEKEDEGETQSESIEDAKQPPPVPHTSTKLQFRSPLRQDVCKYFINASHVCRWGASCRFLHPGVNDKEDSNDEQQSCNTSPADDGEGCNMFVVCESWDEAEKCIRNYEVETNTKFAIYRKHIAFNTPGKIDISKHKIQFEDIKEPGKKQCIRFTGIPFIVLGAKYLDCVYGTDRNVTTKKKRFEKEDEIRKLVIKVTGDPALAKKRRAVRDTKKVGCPVSIVVRDVIFFPQFIASRDTRWFRTETSKVLRDAFAKDSEAVAMERKFYIKFPDVESHVGHHIHENDITHSEDVSVGQKRCHSSVGTDSEENEANEDEENTISIQGRETDEFICDEIEDVHEETVIEDPDDDDDMVVIDEWSTNGGRQMVDNKDDVFDFTQGTAADELACAVTPQLALGVQNVWMNGVEAEELVECIGRIQTPENCQFVVAPRLQPHVYSQLSQPAKQRDEKRVQQQTLLVKAATPLVQGLDILNSLEAGAITTETIQVLKQHVESSFVCLSQVNLGLLRARREDVVNSVNTECSVVEDSEHASAADDELVEIPTCTSVSNDDESEVGNETRCEAT